MEPCHKRFATKPSVCSGPLDRNQRRRDDQYHAPPGGFLQILAWDGKKGAFNYYDVLDGPIWVWRGDSDHAMREPTRGKGCFKCHVNGNPNMKELKFPWNNWSSMVAPIADNVASPQSPLSAEPLFKNKQGSGDSRKNRRSSGDPTTERRQIWPPDH